MLGREDWFLVVSRRQLRIEEKEKEISKESTRTNSNKQDENPGLWNPKKCISNDKFQNTTPMTTSNRVYRGFNIVLKIFSDSDRRFQLCLLKARSVINEKVDYFNIARVGDIVSIREMCINEAWFQLATALPPGGSLRPPQLDLICGEGFLALSQLAGTFSSVEQFPCLGSEILNIFQNSPGFIPGTVVFGHSAVSFCLQVCMLTVCNSPTSLYKGPVTGAWAMALFTGSLVALQEPRRAACQINKKAAIFIGMGGGVGGCVVTQVVKRFD
uniref:Uncharacterized protein n=1 Tax=Glossina austeni TaxID=7395 RepID=A0A1A9UES7_GLOAU